MPDLLDTALLPKGFEYPQEFLRVVGLELIDWEPWWILTGSLLRERHKGLRERFPDRVPARFIVFDQSAQIDGADVGPGI
ncbi:MAG: hypothetical protein LBL55_02600 [Propionibacteriaceae bacterium]|jgi:hypothetical protein|nr:hypothetical protein [Propionibacteriaceae bacterium]